MTIDMKKTNRNQSDQRTTMIVKHLEENRGFQDNTDQGEFECKTCKKRFQSYQALGGHTASHKMTNFNNKIDNELNLNYVPTVSSSLHECKICAKEFKTAQALGSHMRIHNLGNGLNVVEENRGFQDNTDQGEFECETCKKRFQSNQALGDHTASHKKIKPNNKIDNELSLNYVPTVSSSLHECKICAKEFKTAQALGSHMRIHNLGKGLNVVEENQGFQDNTDQGEFECKTCKKRFQSYQALGGHTASHKEIKPNNKIDNELNLNNVPTVSSWLHQCKICAKEFKTAQALGSHMRIHKLGEGLNVVEEKGLSQQEAEKEKVESDLESGSSVLTMVELERRKAEEDEQARVRRELNLGAKEWQLFPES